MAQIAAELLPHDADPQLAHALMPIFEGMVGVMLDAARAAVKEEIEKQGRRIERHEIWTMERLDERSATINEVRADQRAMQTQVSELRDDVDILKAQAVGEPGDGT